VNLRLKAFGLHLLGSACALALVVGGLCLGWYRWPGWYLASVLHVVGIVLMVDVVIGPTLTLVVANPGKPRRELARDIGIIVAVQVIALVYGAVTLWMGRPLYYTFSVDRLEMVQASDFKPADIALGRRDNPAMSPHWYSLPRWTWAPLPEDPKEAAEIIHGAVFGDTDVIEMPRYFKPWDQGLPKLRAKLATLDSIIYFSRAEKRRLRARMGQLGLAADEKDAMVLWGGSRRLLAIFDLKTLEIRVLLRPD
jgi:hypothetical protein